MLIQSIAAQVRITCGPLTDVEGILVRTKPNRGLREGTGASGVVRPDTLQRPAGVVCCRGARSDPGCAGLAAVRRPVVRG
jgi:hypothetical protein